MGVTVSHASLLAQCRALTQACGYSEGKARAGPTLCPGRPRAGRLFSVNSRADMWSVGPTCHQFTGAQEAASACDRADGFALKNGTLSRWGHRLTWVASDMPVVLLELLPVQVHRWKVAGRRASLGSLPFTVK